MTFLAAGSRPPQLPDTIKPAATGLLHLIGATWPVWVLLGVLALCRGSYYLYRRRRLASSGISEIDSMDGRAFELFLATLFRRLGYRVEVTRARGDHGADLVVERDGRKLAVQAKRWQKDIGVKAIQEAVGSIAMYRCDGAMVVTNREFTRQ